LLGRLSKRLVLALDADEAGIRSGLKSALMALEAGFDVKVPTFPQGADPADVARQNPELLKAAVRTSKTAVEFFLEALRPMARDERAYKKEVEAKVLPLVAAIESRIEQEHFIRIVATKLGVSDLAVRAEVERTRTKMQAAPAPAGDDSSDLHQKRAELALTAFEKKAGMLLASWPAAHEPLRELLGDAFDDLRQKVAPHEEELRHHFDREIHADTEARVVAEDMLAQLRDTMRRAKMKSV
jgi:DNA primase